MPVAVAEASRRPIIPAALRPANFQATARRAGGRAAHVAERQHFDLETFGAARDDQRIADAYAARGFGALPADIDLAGLDGVFRQCARLVETRRP